MRSAAHPDTEGLPCHEEFPDEIYRNAERDGVAAGVECYLALRDGQRLGFDRLYTRAVLVKHG